MLAPVVANLGWHFFVSAPTKVGIYQSAMSR